VYYKPTVGIPVWYGKLGMPHKNNVGDVSVVYEMKKEISKGVHRHHTRLYLESFLLGQVFFYDLFFNNDVKRV